MPSTFKFDKRTDELLAGLVSRTHSLSKAEVLRKSITLLDACTKGVENGKSVVLKDNQTGKETEILLW